MGYKLTSKKMVRIKHRLQLTQEYMGEGILLVTTPLLQATLLQNSGRRCLQ